MRTPSKPAARLTAAHGFLRSERGAPSFASSDHMGVAFNARNVRKHFLGCGGKIERLFPGLAVGEEN